MLNIHKPKPGDQAWYHLTSANRTKVGYRLMEFVHQKVVSLKMIAQENGDTVYEYHLEAQRLDGTALIHEWAVDMEALQTPLTIVLDDKGRLKDIKNFHDLRDKWDSYYASRLRKKYKENKEGAEALIAETSLLLRDKPRFLQSLHGYSAWRFFFQDDFDGEQGTKQQPLVLKGFFGQVDLPLMLASTWQEEYGIGQYNCSLENKGKLDESQFDRKQFARMLKDLTGVYNVSAKLDLIMEEQFQYDKHHWLTAGEMFLETKVSDWYAVATAHTLERISETDALHLKKNFNVSAEETA